MKFIPGCDQSFANVLGLYDTPAYVRRGLQLVHAFERLFRCCERVRDEQLRWVRMYLQLLRPSVSNWQSVREYLVSEQDYRSLCDLFSLLPPSVAAVPRATVIWGLGSQLRSVTRSVRQFNARWMQVLAGIDLSEVNGLVAAYNRYYLLEKECALRSPRLAARGFESARAITLEDLSRRYPLLACPRLRLGVGSLFSSSAG